MLMNFFWNRRKQLAWLCFKVTKNPRRSTCKTLDKKVNKHNSPKFKTICFVFLMSNLLSLCKWCVPSPRKRIAYSLTIATEIQSAHFELYSILQQRTMTKRITKTLWNWDLSLSSFHFFLWDSILCSGPSHKFFSCIWKAIVKSKSLLLERPHQFYDIGSWE